MLHDHPENPLPAGAVETTLSTPDGLRLRAAHWLGRGAVQGTVAILQGRAEFIEKYAETIADLLGRGFAVATFDWRGQGGSERLLADPRKGHVRRFADYLVDLQMFFAGVMEQCPKPWFALGHSMGGAILIEALHENRISIARAVATAPMLGIARITHPRMTRALALGLTMIGLARRYVPGGGATSIMTKPFDGNPLTSDARRYWRNGRITEAFPRLALGDPTIGWLSTALAQILRFETPRYALDLRTPLLIVAAAKDEVVSTPVIEAFSARCKTGPALLIPGARHEILQERDEIRGAFFAAFDAFVPGSA